MFSPIAPPRPAGPLPTLPATAGAPPADPIPPLSLGERLSVRVLGHTPDRKVLLQVKDATLRADAPFPLTSGETLTVQVEQLHPSLVLRAAAPEGSVLTRGGESLRWYRSHPGALQAVFAALAEALGAKLPGDGAPGPAGKLLRNLREALNRLLLTEESLARPERLRESIGTLGLTDERALFLALSDPSRPEGEPAPPTLKRLLLQLAGGPEAGPAAGEEDAGAQARQLRQLGDFAGRAAAVIESLQVVNVLAQEQDGCFLLPIPLQFPDGIRLQEMVVETDREQTGLRAAAGCRVVLFLDMDALGRMAVDAHLGQGALHCTLKCEGAGAAAFLEPCLPELGTALAGMAGGTSGIQCLWDPDLGRWKQEFLQEHRCFSMSTVDVRV